MLSQPPLLTERRGAVLALTLNRPAALNSVTIEMVRLIDSALDLAEADPQIRSITVTGAGERAFCAGGDIRQLRESRAAGAGPASLFWGEEYRLNARIAGFSKPYIALVDGICMGAGVGLASHGRLRIVTERARVAMPETGIGFIPDVGATWLLSRKHLAFGRYLALTGLTIGAGDAIAAGLADLMVPSSALPQIMADLGDGASPQEIAATYQIRPDGGIWLAQSDEIEAYFADNNISAILARLQQSDTPFARETAAVLASRSPISLLATADLMARAQKAAQLEDCLNAEYHAGLGALFHHDFGEGVRAAIIDKDRNPRWNPASLAEVSPADLLSYLAPKPGAPFPDRMNPAG